MLHASTEQRLSVRSSLNHAPRRASAASSTSPRATLMVVRAAASLAGGYMAVSLKDRPVDRGQQDSRLQRYETIVSQLSAQRLPTPAQCFNTMAQRSVGQ